LLPLNLRLRPVVQHLLPRSQAQRAAGAHCGLQDNAWLAHPLLRVQREHAP
jgi:hypothetical protein